MVAKFSQDLMVCVRRNAVATGIIFIKRFLIGFQKEIEQMSLTSAMVVCLHVCRLREGIAYGFGLIVF